MPALGKDLAAHMFGICDPVWPLHSSKGSGNPSSNCFHGDLHTALDTNAAIFPLPNHTAMKGDWWQPHVKHHCQIRESACKGGKA